jgi:hypothetical protein
MAVDQQAIVFPGSQFRALLGDYDPDTIIDLPAKTVAYEGAWAIDDLGFTRGGVIIQVNRTIQDEYFDQSVDPELQIVTQRDIRLRTVLGEATLEHITAAFGFGTFSHVDSTTLIHGDDTLFIDGALPPIKDIVVGLEAKMRDNHADAGDPLPGGGGGERLPRLREECRCHRAFRGAGDERYRCIRGTGPQVAKGPAAGSRIGLTGRAVPWRYRRGGKGEGRSRLPPLIESRE